MKRGALAVLVAAVTLVVTAGLRASATPTPDPECVGKNPGDVCRAATTCSDAQVCSGNLKCPTGPANPDNYNGTPCESDNDACTNDVCAGGECRHQIINCDDGNACTVDGCDQVLGCVYTPTSCDDGVACTADTCDPVTGCQHTFITDDCGTATCGTSPCGNTCGPACSATCVPQVTCPNNATVECVDGEAQNTLGAATATCDADITNSGDGSYTFSCSGSNSHDVTYTATNGDGSDGCTATLTVEDTQKPNASCDSNSTIRTSEQAGVCNASLIQAASGTDACEGTLAGTCDPNTLSLNAPG